MLDTWAPIFLAFFTRHIVKRKGDVERRITMVTIAMIAVILLISYKLVIGLFRIAMEGL